MDQQAVIDNELALAISDIVESGRLGSTRFLRCIVEVRSEVNLETVADGFGNPNFVIHKSECCPIYTSIPMALR